MDNLKLIFKKKNIKKTDLGILDNVKLRFENEPASHKLLDLIGDLALLGVPIQGHVTAARAGHASNVEFVKKLKKEYKSELSEITKNITS